MSLYQVEKLFFDLVTDPVRQSLYRQDVGKLLDHYDLTATERQAIVDVDVTQLFEMNVEPLLLQPFASMHEMSSADLFAATGRAKNWDNRSDFSCKVQD